MPIVITSRDLGFKRLRANLAAADGVRVKAGIIDDEENASKGAWNEFGTSTIPARPWLSVAGDSLLVEAAITVNAEAIADGKAPVQAAAALGETIADVARDVIEGQTVGGPPLADATVARNGHADKLIDTGEMLDAIRSEVTR